MKLTFCCACGSWEHDALEHHHLVARAQGGIDDETNLLTLCSGCHGKLHGVAWRDNRRELQRAGIERAKVEHPERFQGRPPSIDADRVVQLKAQGARPVDIAKQLGISRTSVYRLMPSPEHVPVSRTPPWTQERVDALVKLAEAA